MSERVLVVEDEPDLAFALEVHLKAEGFAVECAGDGDAALAAARPGRFDLILLDLRLPGRDGTDVLRTLRAAGDRTPVICLTARAEERDRVLGLDLGADDYVTKPFSTPELLARIRALLRRTRSGPESSAIDLGAVRLHLAEHEADVAGKRVALTLTEVEILRFLAARQGAVVDRQELLREVWGLDRGATTRTLDNHVARVRKKIEHDAAHPRHLITVHGSGYRLAHAD